MSPSTIAERAFLLGSRIGRPRRRKPVSEPDPTSDAAKILSGVAMKEKDRTARETNAALNVLWRKLGGTLLAASVALCSLADNVLTASLGDLPESATVVTGIVHSASPEGTAVTEAAMRSYVDSRINDLLLALSANSSGEGLSEAAMRTYVDSAADRLIASLPSVRRRDWLFSAPGDYSVSWTDTSPDNDTFVRTYTLRLNGDVIDTTFGPETSPDETSQPIYFLGGSVVATPIQVDATGKAVSDYDDRFPKMDVRTLEVSPQHGLTLANYGASNEVLLAVHEPDLGMLGWRRPISLFDESMFETNQTGKIRIVVAPSRSAWSWDAERRKFSSPYVQICRAIHRVSQDVAKEVVDDGATTNSFSQFPTTGAFYIAVDNVSKTPSLYLTQGAVPVSTDAITYLYVATVVNNVQTDGIYSMPSCPLWE